MNTTNDKIAAEVRERLMHLAEPLIELNRRLAKLRREGQSVSVAAVNDGPTDDTGYPGLKIYTDDGWVLVDLVCQLSNGMFKPAAGEVITIGPGRKSPGQFGDKPEVAPVMPVGVLLTSSGLPSPGQEEHNVEV